MFVGTDLELFDTVLLPHFLDNFLQITGKGLPFFWTTIPGIKSTEETKAKNGGIAKQVRFYFIVLS